ncbi:TonB-dependent receptor, partial [bacterium]|nr:TonB-dependent receptor [bacterium]
NLTLSHGTNLRFSLGEGFRAPAIGERFVSTETGALLVLPNPDLHSEKSISSEMGLTQYFSQTMKLDMAIFYTKYNNLIEPQLDIDSAQDVVVRFKNVMKAQIQGFELTYQTDWWSQLISTQIGYTFIDSKDLSPGEDDGAPLKYRSKHTIYLTNDLNFKSFNVGFDFRYLSQIERIDEYHKSYIKDIDKLVPTYEVALRFGFVEEHFSLRFIIENLFQYNYLVSPANMAPPRTAVVQLNIQY